MAKDPEIKKRPVINERLTDIDIIDYIRENADRYDCIALRGLDWIGYEAALTYADYDKGVGVSLWTAVSRAIGNRAAMLGCDGANTAEDDPYWRSDQQCQAVYGAGNGKYKIIDPDAVQRVYDFGPANGVVEILGWTQLPSGPNGYALSYIDTTGQQTTVKLYTASGIFYAYIEPNQNDWCTNTQRDYLNPPDTPLGPLVEVEDDNCKWVITPVDSYVDTRGIYWTKYDVAPDPSTCGLAFFYWNSQSGIKVCAAEDWDCPPPDARTGGSCAEPSLPSWEYYLEGWCEDPAEWDLPPGEQPEITWSGTEKSASQGLADRLEAIAEMIDFQLIMRSPVCNDAPQLEGEFRTISFRSDDVSPYGKSRLRKRFRYRSVSGVGLDGVVDHWKDFTFQAGPVTVKHVGASWGTITVWASTADEGKRVIRHAAGEAGVDPDQDGRWQIGGSNSARLGVSGTMRVDTKGGYYWITARDGSDHRPLVAKT